MNIGKRIYFDNVTGDVVYETSERSGNVVETTVEYDISMSKALTERNRESFDYIQLEYRQYAEDFDACNGYLINPESKQLEFSYPDPDGPEPQPSGYRPPLSEKVLNLEKENTGLKLGLAELAEAQEQDQTATQLALAEIVESLGGEK
ncbi:hypothetical protein [Paenibacillus thiaminolyticus]|uniref:hypothetical protein n=1 Tax=Paenibacillus thiaminolyticus TaxID=49283 RepID=UPI0025436D0C|nr:hypothetical protein [Paenibacillus thiaminolyticus]WII36365.1 hypothetical protein O0V01_22260 [Paenibacillus thiaminolyticus]